jgi:hypothetical protein
MADLRTQLAEAFPAHKHKLNLYATGRARPEYNRLSIPETFKKFESEFLPVCPLPDALGRKVRVGPNDFRKLLNLKLKNGQPKQGQQIVAEIKAATFDAVLYDYERDRLETLFWIPEVLANPDGVCANDHSVIEADEVFFCVYDKPGSKIKLVFTATYGKTLKIVTSYLTDAKSAHPCIGKLLWPK